jgi:hypothetical protein
MLLYDDDDFLIVHTIYTDPWTWGDFYRALARDQAITRQANGRTVYRVIDFTETKHVPPGALQHFRRARRFLFGDPSVTTLFVATHPVMRALTQTISRMYPRYRTHARSAPSVEEAYALIERLTTSEML